MSTSLRSLRNAERGRRIRAERKAAGVCVGCGRVPAVADRTYCAKCLAKLNRRQKERVARRKTLGQCVTCGRPRAEGIFQCRRCRPLSEKVAAMRLAKRQRLQAKEERAKRARLLASKHLDRLTRRQRDVLGLRAGLNLKGTEVAAILGITRQGVSAIEKSAWRRIHRAEAGTLTRHGTLARHKSTASGARSIVERAA